MISNNVIFQQLWDFKMVDFEEDVKPNFKPIGYNIDDT